jgi:hypothetical protein
MHSLTEDEEEDKREKVIEENDGPLAEGQLEIQREECLEGFHRLTVLDYFYLSGLWPLAFFNALAVPIIPEGFFR